MKVVVMTPDLADRSRIAGVAPDAVFVGAAAALPGAAEGADLVVVDLTRAGVTDVLDAVVRLAGRVVGYGPHVAADLLALATAAGVEAVPRSRFFRELHSFIGTKQS